MPALGAIVAAFLGPGQVRFVLILHDGTYIMNSWFTSFTFFLQAAEYICNYASFTDSLKIL